MAVHSNFVDLMDRLVAVNGRPVSVRKQTGSTPKDPTRPELGSVAETTDYSRNAVFLDSDLRDLLLALPGMPDQRTMITREIDRLVLVPAKNLAVDIDLEDRLVDGSVVWEITRVIKIQPGPTLVGYILRVSS